MLKPSGRNGIFRSERKINGKSSKTPMLSQNRNGKINGKIHGAVAPCDCSLHARSMVAQIAQCFLVAQAGGRSGICTGPRACAFPTSCLITRGPKSPMLPRGPGRGTIRALRGALAPRNFPIARRPGSRESMGRFWALDDRARSETSHGSLALRKSQIARRLGP